MIEIIYKEEQKKAEGNEGIFRIPNNIRQIGEIKGHQKIYIEDYAYTFLKKISRNLEEGGKAAILFGKYHWSEGCSYLFVTSALKIKDLEVTQEHLALTDKVWSQVYEEGRKYFPEQEIVGWFVSLPGFNMQINEVLLKTHLNHFAGQDKTLFVMEPGEWEEAFFIYENNQLVRQPGYYIYYEKNNMMQNYMIEMSENKSIEETEKIPDRAVADFRKVVKGKKETEEGQEIREKKHSQGWILGSCAAAALLAVGITFFNSYQNMQHIFDGLFSETTVEQEAQSASVGHAEVKVTKEPTPLIPEETQETKESVENKSEEWADDAARAEALKKEEEKKKQEPSKEPEIKKDSETEETSASVGQEYTIKRGDTLTSICRMKYGSVERLYEICQVNGIAPEEFIYPGQKLILPD